MFEKKCLHCKWCVVEDPKNGFCHRYPPTVLAAGSSSFPVVNPMWWCGNYRRNWVQWFLWWLKPNG